MPPGIHARKQYHMSIVAIVNPKAGRRTGPYIPASAEILQTKSRGHAIELTADAIRRGATVIVAIGGDGTINEVVNGFFDGDRPISHNVKLAIIPHGTGSDFRRVLNLPWDESKAAALIRTGTPRTVDVMKVRYTRSDGTNALRYSINVTSFGVGGAVAARANRSWKPLGGTIAMLAATIRTTLVQSGIHANLTIDGSKTINAKIMNVAVGNGQFHGSGMWVCPGASIDDGFFDVTVIRHVSIFRLLRNLPMLYNGSIYSHPNVDSYRAKRIQATSFEPALIEIDGEPLGRLPIDIEIVPSAIRVLMP